MLNYIERWLKYGCQDELDDEANRRIVVINLFSIFGISLTFFLGVNAYTEHSVWMGHCLILICLLFILARIHLNTAERPETQLCCIVLLIMSLIGLMSLLVVTGGIDNTGPLWIFILPPVAFFFAGFIRGMYFISGFTVFICILLFFPDNQLLMAVYPESFKLRLLLSFLLTILLSGAYEFTRQKSFETIQSLNDRHEHLAMHDALTGLHNRHFMNECIQRETARACRNEAPLSVIICDIDNFKKINDSNGHEVGDATLRRVGKLLKESVRKQDLVARWGGEEFLFVLPDTDLENALSLAHAIRVKFNQIAIPCHEQRLTVTASFGVAQIATKYDAFEALSRADHALYRAKRAGRDQVATG